MNLVERMKNMQTEQDLFNFKLSDGNTCIDMMPYRRVDDLYPFHSKIIFDVEGDQFCTLVATEDAEIIVREVIPGIEFFGEYDEVEISRDDEKLHYRFMHEMSAEDVKELTLAKLV